jgi:hypothetical protein
MSNYETSLNGGMTVESRTAGTFILGSVFYFVLFGFSRLPDFVKV